LKALKELMRESFGNEEQVFHFYNLGQEEASLEGVKEWLTQKRQDATNTFLEAEKQAFIDDLLKELQTNANHKSEVKP
jgi:hypothetical protein